MATEVDDFVLRTACEQLAAWRHVSDWLPAVGVNLSASQVGDPLLLDRVRALLQETGINASQLRFEITEAALQHNEEVSLANVRGLHELGAKVGIDGFGTGFSSLTYLRRYPVDFIKIDRSLTAGVGTNTDATTTVAAVIGLGRVLDLQVVATGVETEEQAAQLGRLGCDHAQGFLFARSGSFEQLGIGRGMSGPMPTVRKTDSDRADR
jgi:EAL domain-containing protein (putative c-di-GMP-specific phosphodiesterase class I)